MINDTITAIATGLTNAGISIIRISGPESLNIASKIFKTKSKDGLKAFDAIKSESHTVHYGFIVDGETEIDEVMLLILKAPRTYTREDVVEIDCHGGITVTKRVLETILKNGARIADPGEFTKRAFLNGRIDLSQAEAVINIINAKNNMAVNNSIKQLGGAELFKINELRDNILRDTAFIEAALDDPEHISLDGFTDELSMHVSESIQKITVLLENSKNGRLMMEGINTCLVGKPNAGKSTLLNAILGEDRAIVTDIEGTTRDTLEETVSFGGVTLNIIDTAGIRSTGDEIEKIGVSRALRAMESADLVLYVVDASRELNDNDFRIMEEIKDRRTIVLVNKSDIKNSFDFSALDKLDAPKLNISAKLGDGLEVLGNTIKDMFFTGKIQANDEVYITSLRHTECLEEALSALKNVKASVELGMPEDFFTIDLLNAYQALGRIIGEEMDEDLINKIFKDFCMGK